ncbi:MAG: glycosyl transferase family 2, partial [Anaerolineales bacterium]
MPGIFFIPVAIVYLVVVSLLFVYGLNFFYLSWLTWRSRGQPQATPQLTEWPRVTVQLPIFNELYVAERVIRAAARLDYPSHLLEI